MAEPSADVASAPAVPRRPQLKAGLRRLWRDAGTLQIGLDPRHAVVLQGADAAVATFLDRLDGTVPLDDLATLAAATGLDPDDATALVRRLAAHGVLDDAAADTSASRGLSASERDRIAPDLAAWSIAAGSASGGERTHRSRRSARVDVHGAGRVGALAAVLLTHAGVGELHVVDPDPLRAADVPAPWARSAPADASAPPRRADVALDVCEQLAPSLRTPRRRPRRGKRPPGPAIVLVAPVDTAGTLSLELRDSLLREGVPHLPAYVRETVGVVGPLVVPGRTPCLRCVDLSRAERDPAWPHLLAQLCPPQDEAARRRSLPPAEPSDGVLATAVAALATSQLLAFLDGGEPGTLGASIEIDAEGLTRRKVWAAHPACGCRWR